MRRAIILGALIGIEREGLVTSGNQRWNKRLCLG